MRLVRRYDQDEREIERRCSLEFDGTKTAKRVPETWREARKGSSTV